MGTQPMLQQQKPKPKMPVYAGDNVLESLRGIGTSVGKTVVKDVITQSGNDMLRSILGGPTSSGELRQHQVIELGKTRQENAPAHPATRTPELNRTNSLPEDAQVKQKIEEIRMELKALSQSVKQLHQEITKTIMETPVDPGIYHLNFFDHLRSYLQAMKENIDDSRTWLAASNNCKAKKGYWGQFKKHGTSWGMSNERSIATSAG